MTKPYFSGACTALVTPFLHNEINLPMLDQLLIRQLEAGIQAIVISGTTGESPVLSDEEKIIMIRRAKAVVQEDCLIIAGTGSNDTSHTIQLSMEAEKAGADALLIVTPYYNKPTPEGLFRHFQAVAQAVRIPVILYNVPGRTGVDIPVSVYERLSRISNIIGVKEASRDVTKMARINRICPNSFSVWCGNDDLTVPMMVMGARGVISVLSNLFPLEAQAMAMSAASGNFDTAAALQTEFIPLIDLLFCESNPIPVKAAMKLLGYDCGECRLPLPSLSKDNLQKLQDYFT